MLWVRHWRPHLLHPEHHEQAFGDESDVLAHEGAIHADECDEERVADELELHGDGVDDDVAGAGLIQLASVGGGDIGSGAQEEGAEGGIEHEGEEDDAETKRPGGGLVVEVVEPVHDVVDVNVGADGDERVEAVLGHLVLERRATQP